MPFVDGVFEPPPFRKHTTALFNVLPPDHPDSEATVEDHEWYVALKDAVADLLVYFVKHVRRTYDQRRGVSWSRPVVHGKDALAKRIAVLLDGELSHRQVSKAVARLAKQFGLVVYSTEPGERFNWPMAGRFLTHEEALRIADDAFWERWPDSV